MSTSAIANLCYTVNRGFPGFRFMPLKVYLLDSMEAQFHTLPLCGHQPQDLTS